MKPCTLCLLAAALMLGACKTPNDEPEASPPKERATDKPTPRRADSTKAPTDEAAGTTFDPVKVPGTPHNEELTTVALTWSADSAEVPVYRSMGASKTSGNVKMTKGTPVEYAESQVLITDAMRLTPRAGTELQGASSFTPSTGAVAEAMRNEKLTPEDTVYLLMYAGEGTCYFQVNSDYYLATCPSEDDYEPVDDFSQTPLDSQWWIRIDGAQGKGWLQVDDRIDVKVESSM